MKTNSGSENRIYWKRLKEQGSFTLRKNRPSGGTEMASNSGILICREYPQVLICTENQRKGKKDILKQEGYEIR